MTPPEAALGNSFVNPMNWVTRYRVQRPFSRRLRVAPSLLAEAPPPWLLSFAADAGFDPLAGAFDFLAAAYAGDAARARTAMARLDTGKGARSVSRLFAENDFRKLLVGCFRHALEGGTLDPGKAGLLLDFARRFDPVFDAFSRGGSAQAAVPTRLAFDYAGRVPPTLSIVVLVPGGASARSYDLGQRLLSAFTGAGVVCRLVPSESDPGEIGAADLVLVDENTVFRKDPEKQQAHLDRLRQVARRLGRLVPDPWGKGFREQLARGIDRYDLVWAMAPTLRDAAPIAGEKFCLIPFPSGFARVFDGIAAAAPLPAIGFCGAIEDYNHHRYFWLLSALAGAMDLKIALTSQQPDGLDVEASYGLYLERLLETAACLSLTMRSTGDRILVGRTFDVLRGSRLLIQEYTPDARFYLAPGEDFVEIQGAEDLREVHGRFRAGDYEAVRRQGAETFRRAYSDDAVIRHLATFL